MGVIARVMLARLGMVVMAPSLHSSKLSAPSVLHHRPGVTIVAIVLTALALRVYLMLATTYVWDEERYWIPSALGIAVRPDHLHLPIRELSHPALPAYLIRLSSVLFGENVAGFRALSLVAGVITIVIGWRIAREYAGPVAGLWTAIALAFNDYHIAMSGLAIERSFYLAFVTAAVWMFLRFLRSTNGKYLYMTAIMAGLAYMTYEVALVIPLACFIVLLTTSYRPWLQRKVTVLAALAFLLVISPDVFWNVSNRGTGGATLSWTDNLSRIGSFGLNPQPLVLFGRDAIVAVYRLLGRHFVDHASIYPTVNVMWGPILLLAVTYMTLRDARRDAFLRFLSIIFWTILLGFLFIRPAPVTRANVTPNSWQWVDIVVIPAVIVTGILVGRMRGKWGVVVSGAVAGAAMGATIAVVVFRLHLPTESIGFSPQWVWPLDGRTVAVQVGFSFCPLCQVPSSIELAWIRERDIEGHWIDPGSDGQGWRLVSDALGRADRLFVVKASPGRVFAYDIAYRLYDGGGPPRYLGAWVILEPNPVWVRPSAFWVGGPDRETDRVWATER